MLRKRPRRRRTAEEIRESSRNGEILYRFRWPRDKDGYVITPGPDWSRDSLDIGGPSLLSLARAPDMIRGRGGPLDYYEPMKEHPGLWREFANRCTTPEAVLEFSREYGLPTADWRLPHEQMRAYVPDIIAAAANIGRLIELMDAHNWTEATNLFNHWAHGLAVMQIEENAVRPIPVTLLSAMLIQAAEAILDNQVWRRCQNPACHKWFQLGMGTTKRRLFCDGRCRQAYNRGKDAAEA